MAKITLPITADVLRRYAAGELSHAEQHAVERAALSDPMVADALEGFELLARQKKDDTAAIAALKQQVQRMGQPVVRLQWQRLAVAASILAVIGILGLLLFQQERPPEAVSMQQSKPMPSVSADSQALAVVPQPAEVPAVKPYAPTEPPAARMAPRTESVSPAAKQAEVMSMSATPAELADTPAPPMAASSRMLRMAKTDSSALRRGVVVDEQNAGLPGVVVTVKGKNAVVLTDSSGHFVVPAGKEDDTLQLQFIGHVAKSIRIQDAAASPIQLKLDTTALNEVVVVGYGTQRKQEITGSVSTLPSNRKVPITTIAPAAYQQYVIQEARKTGIRTGTVRVRFGVQSDGSLTDFRIRKSAGDAADQEAIRIIKEGPAWQPALRKGRPVSRWVTVDVPFN